MNDTDSTQLREMHVDWRSDLGLSWTEHGSAMARHAHALHDGEQAWLIDPFDVAGLDAELATLGVPIRHVVVLLDRHMRDAAAIADRHGATLHVVAGPIRQQVPATAVRFDTELPGSPFTVVPVRSTGMLWQERALWWPEHELLVIAESVGTGGPFTIGTECPAAVHPALRLTPPTAAFAQATPQVILFGHGAPVTSDATQVLQQALAESRSRTPQLLAGLARAGLSRIGLRD